MKYNELFIREFFTKRFRKPELDPSYYDEWVDRFKGGTPETYMDKKSIKIFNKLKSTRIKHVCIADDNRSAHIEWFDGGNIIVDLVQLLEDGR